jgi:alpha-L-rhamnosidase
MPTSKETSLTDHPAVTASITAEYRTDTDLVAVAAPRLSWKSHTEAPDWTQASATIRLRDSETVIGERTVSGRDSVLVAWPFPRLVPRQSVAVQVQTHGADGSTSAWSDPLPIRAGFLADGEWAAPFVGIAQPRSAGQPGYLRSAFIARSPVARATLYATAHGVYQATINGSDVDDEVLKPGWTAYQFRLVHETTDVTALLVPGENVIGIRLAGGWYTEEYGFTGIARRFYGEQPAVAAQLFVEYVDGTTELVLTGDDWVATTDGPLRSSGIYAGESYDASKADAGWSTPGYDASSWSPVRVDGMRDVVPEARFSPAVRRIQDVPAVEIIRADSGRWIVDFGQNLVGWVRLTVRGSRGDMVTLRHAEVLEHREIGIRHLRGAEATDHYTLAGDGVETWEPEFTFHGFRYVEVDGWPGKLSLSDITAVVVHSDMVRTGWFDSSHELVNKLHENVVWGMRGNFLSLPTDCPQRDERLGWTGDIQVFAPTAAFLYQSDGFLSSWLRDLDEEQSNSNGLVPVVVPAVLDEFNAPSTPVAAWGDAATVVPHVLLERFGDLRVFRDQYRSMKAWADVLLDAADADTLVWEGQFQFGDWLDPDAPADFPEAAKTQSDLLATAHLFRSVDLVAVAAERLGEAADALHYGQLAERIRAAFIATFVSARGRLVSDSTTAYAMAIRFGIVTDAAVRQAMGDRLAQLVRTSGYHISTGFVGTPIIQDALTDAGHLSAAERLITQTENPSWLYPVTMGATTIWERWDSMLEDGSIHSDEMTSFNHYAFGAVADWLHRVVAGLAPAADAYREIEIAPRVLSSFDHASARLDTAYGRAESGWRRNVDGTVTVMATVPANATAIVTLPDGSPPIAVGSGTHEWLVSTEGQFDAPPTALTWKSTLAAVADDAEGYRVLIAAVESVDPRMARALRRHGQWVERVTVSDAVMGTLPIVRERIVAAFDELNRSRGIAG